jgi:hypothetical protein
MRDYYAEQERMAPRHAPHTLQDLTPYLGLRARLSQVWINRWTILILLVLARVLIAIGDLRNDINNAKTEALAACASVEAMGSTMASMPHYLASGTNELAAHGVEKAVGGLEEMLMMTITGVEEIFVFVVNMMYGTYECLITVAVSSAAHTGIALMEDATTALNNTLSSFNKSIHQDADSFTNGLNTFLSTFNNVGNFLTGGHNQKPPSLNLDGPINTLNGFKLPTDINDKLSALNGSIPDFSQVKNATNTILRLPFEEIKTLVNQSLGTYTFDRSVFPVPARQELTFCSDSDGINGFFNELYNVADIARKIFIVVLLLAAALACVPMTLLEIRRWRAMQKRVPLVLERALDGFDTAYLITRPYTSGFGLNVSRWFATPKKQILSRWFIAYITTTPALVVLAIALAGLFSCLCQFILLKAIQREVPQLVNTIGAFTDKVVNALDQASAEWANGTNTAILAENSKINNDVFGWVNTSASTLNSTLNSFIQETTGLINKTFGGTVLEEPIFGLFQCLVGLKVASIEQGLTWAQDNAHIDFPLFPNNTFSQGAQQAVASSDPTTGTGNDSFVADPGSDATDKITATVLTLTDKLEEGIRQEALLAGLVLCAYVIVVFMGLGRVIFQLIKREPTRAEGGASHAGDLDGNNLAMQSMGQGPIAPNPTGDSAFSRQVTGRTERNPFPSPPTWYPAEETKTGFAGEREAVPTHEDTKGLSVYGVLENEKI